MAFGGHACGPKPDNKRRAIEMGLPNPVITVTEYMDTSGGGFEWATAIPQVCMALAGFHLDLRFTSDNSPTYCNS